IHELQEFSVNVHVADPMASPNEVAHEYKLTLVDKFSTDYDAVVVAVAHREYAAYDMNFYKSIMGKNPILMDLKAIYENSDPDVCYWRL
ncbi:MAG: nucleotide sugar dehydrogenase, partial [Saprospiraceae bacterium]|nr:nucleotide sugar dehydrogenase [Saprospiraceae bacterium]